MGVKKTLTSGGPPPNPMAINYFRKGRLNMTFLLLTKANSIYPQTSEIIWHHLCEFFFQTFICSRQWKNYSNGLYTTHEIISTTKSILEQLVPYFTICDFCLHRRLFWQNYSGWWPAPQIFLEIGMMFFLVLYEAIYIYICKHFAWPEWMSWQGSSVITMRWCSKKKNTRVASFHLNQSDHPDLSSES